MPNRKNIYVSTGKQGGWQVKTEGARRSASTHRTKSEAVDAGRKIAKNRSGELFIRNRNGRFSDRDSYGNDPMPPRDKVH